jgi:hypothetical protein
MGSRSPDNRLKLQTTVRGSLRVRKDDAKVGRGNCRRAKIIEPRDLFLLLAYSVSPDKTINRSEIALGSIFGFQLGGIVFAPQSMYKDPYGNLFQSLFLRLGVPNPCFQRGRL